MAAECTETDRRIRALEHAVFGNGTPGLKERVTVLGVEMNQIQEMRGDINKRMTLVERQIWMAAGALVVVEILVRAAMK